MRFLKLLFLFLLLGSVVQAQSLFSPLPKPKIHYAYSRALVGPFDSLPANKSYTGFRFTGPMVMYATSFKDLSRKDLFTFMGISFTKASFDAATQKFFTDWAIGLLGGVGGQLAPTNVSAVTAIGLSLSTQKIGKTKLPFLLTVGGIYNITTHVVQPGVGPGVSLLN